MTYRVCKRRGKGLGQSVSDHGRNPGLGGDRVDGDLLSGGLAEGGRLVRKRDRLGTMHLHMPDREELLELGLGGEEDGHGSSGHVACVNHGGLVWVVCGHWEGDLAGGLGLARGAQPVGEEPVGPEVNDLGIVLGDVLLNACVRL